MTVGDALRGVRLTDAISAAMVELYAEFCDLARTTATTFTAAIERLTRRSVAAFPNANQTSPCVACALLSLDASPVAMA